MMKLWHRQVALKPTSIMDRSCSRSRSPIAKLWPPPAYVPWSGTQPAEPPQLDFGPNRRPIDFLVNCPYCQGTAFSVDADHGLLKCLHRPCGHTFPPFHRIRIDEFKNLEKAYNELRASDTAYDELRAEASYLVPIVLYHWCCTRYLVEAIVQPYSYSHSY